MGKIISYKNLGSVLDQLKSQGSLILVGGCFDILHAGHLKFLEEAKKQGDTLLVVLESDASIKRKKGVNRPVNTQEKRAESLAKLAFVDYVIKIPDFKENEDYYALVKKLQPDIIAVTVNDPLLDIKNDQAKTVDGRVIEVIDRIPNLSTTEVIRKRLNG